MKILAKIVNIDLNCLLPTSSPNAIPGFSIKVILKKLSIMFMLEPCFIPLVMIPRPGRFIPFTKNLLIWSIITIINETNKILNVIYPRMFLHSMQCWVIGTNSNLSLGINGQVSHKYLGSSMQSIHSPYVPWSILVSASCMYPKYFSSRCTNI